MASSSIADSVDGLLLVPMHAQAILRPSAATWVKAIRLTARLQLSLRSTWTKPNAIMPRLSLLCRPIRLSNTCRAKQAQERMLEARAWGYRIGTLQSTPTGLNLYRRLGVPRVLHISGVPLARGVSHTLCDHPGSKSDAHFHLSTKNTSEGSPFTGTLSRQAFRPSQKFI